MADTTKNALDIQCSRMVERLRSARHDSGVTLAEASSRSGLAVSTITRMENGFIKHVKTEHIKVLADIYKVNAGWLFGLDLPRQDETEEHEQARRSISDDLMFCSLEDLVRIRHFMDDFIKISREDI